MLTLYYTPGACLQIELAAYPRNLSATNREADIAFRMTPPHNDYRAVARRVGNFEYAMYAASAKRRNLPWITYDAEADVWLYWSLVRVGLADLS